MDQPSAPAARIADLLADNRLTQEAIERLRQRPAATVDERSAREIEVARSELRIQRNDLEVLECQITLQEARLRRYAAAAPDDRDAVETARILRQGLATLQASREKAERRLRNAESNLNRRIVRQQSRRPDHATGADRQ
jgi:hypothetical protein